MIIKGSANKGNTIRRRVHRNPFLVIFLCRDDISELISSQDDIKRGFERRKEERKEGRKEGRKLIGFIWN